MSNFRYNRREEHFDDEVGLHRTTKPTISQRLYRWGNQSLQQQKQQDFAQQELSPYSTRGTHNSQISNNTQNAQIPDGADKTENLLLENKSDETEIYIVYQRHGYLSVLFSIVQTGIVAAMMFKCGMAPLNINPMIGPYPDTLSEWGAKNTVLIVEDNEWWRLLTPILLHAGVIHLLCNIAVQLDTGAFFEREWGSMNWLIIYLVSAVASSALSVVAMPDAISVGSSGAVMGLFGGKGAEVICRFFEKESTDQDRISHQVRKEQCAGVACSVTLVLLCSFIPFVDWAAHLGGLLGGFCVGMIIFAVDLKKAVISKLFWLLVGVAITIAYFAVVFRMMYSGELDTAEELRDVCKYYQENFEDYECNCQRGDN